jgi:demethylmenaquinone methyltransferase/2-methoxy-6-polyprenyl-1,4-benzoquinol methylase
MAHSYYVPGDERAARVKALFDTVAGRYDLINDLQSFGLHRRWKRRLVEWAAPAPGQRALDLCCGTGDVAFALAARGVDTVGLDFSPAMLAVAVAKREKALRAASAAGKSAAGAVQFLRGDAQAIPFPDDTFDLVTISYGLRNLADWRLGLREMWRVARAGGRLLVLDFGKPEQRVWRGVYLAYLRWIVPVFGRVFCGDASAYAYILESLHHYTAHQGVTAELRALGCSNPEVATLLGGVMTINRGVKPPS